MNHRIMTVFLPTSFIKNIRLFAIEFLIVFAGTGSVPMNTLWETAVFRKRKWIGMYVYAKKPGKCF